MKQNSNYSYSNWNIGISSVDISSDNEDLTINMRRENYEQLVDVYCTLTGSSTSEWYSEWKIDMTKGKLLQQLQFQAKHHL